MRALSRIRWMVLFSGILCACSPQAPSSTTTAGSPEGNPTEAEALPAALLNAEFTGVFDGPVRLTDGHYQGPPFVEGGASRPELFLISNPFSRGDLNRDGLDELAVLLAESSGGSGTFIYLALMKEQNEGFSNIGTILLGDRVRVESIDVREGALWITLLEHGPADAASSPTQRKTQQWEWHEERLRKVVVARGHMVYGHEAHELSPCDGGDPYWVLDATDGDLPEVYRGLASQPYEPIFAEVRGLEIPEPGTGFGADFSRQVQVTELLRAAREGPGCAEDLNGVVFRAQGVEPFWHLDVTPESLQLQRLGFESLAVRIEEASRSESEFRWSGSDALAGPAAAEIQPGRCIDPMSGSVFSFQATVSLGETTLTGCAVQGSLNATGTH